MPSSSLLRIIRNVEATKAWEAANPELAAAWNEAMEEDDQRAAEADRRRAHASLMAHLYEHLLSCGMGELDAEPWKAPGIADTDARKAVRDWLAGDKFFLLLWGGAGTGKTVATGEVLKRANDGRAWLSGHARFVTADWLARLSYFDLERYGELCSVRHLVIDDIGLELNSSTFAATLDGLLSERLRHKRRTVLTTNATPTEFAARFAKPGSRLASRLHQHGKTVGCGNVDLRRVSA